MKQVDRLKNQALQTMRSQEVATTILEDFMDCIQKGEVERHDE